jgi:hypothetical protein
VQRTVLESLIYASLASIPGLAVVLASPTAVAAPPTGGLGVIGGVVKDTKSGEPLAGALVILQCACLGQPQERTTSANGVYSFNDLPTGSYTIQVLSGRANVSKLVQLPRGAAFRANFALDPERQEDIVIVVETPVIEPRSGFRIGGRQAQDIPVGQSPTNNWTAVVDISPTSGGDGAGSTIAGQTGASNKYEVDGMNVTSPAFGTVGASIVMEFLQDVEVKESGYDAEFGGASGGQVSARRVAGSSTLRGEAAVRMTPRLAAPRLIQATDEALRVSQVGDYQAQAVVVMSGPLAGKQSKLRDRLFFTIGLAPGGTQFSLRQSFYHRIDLDDSGGYEGCPYENGTNDCVEGGNYIATSKFAEQKFKTGMVNFQYVAGLDWAITPRHKLGFTAVGGPTFQRTTYRLPFAFDPNAFGTNPSADPLGGSSRIATGIVNYHFGTTLAHTTSVGLNYQGRAFDDKLEIDAGVSYFQAVYQDAWRLDNPQLENIPATQEQDNQGRNLYEFLDRSGAVDRVPGVDDACNGSNLPGVACPTRAWLSGGLGEYDRDVQRRVQANLTFTHFFEALGSHQVKWGGVMAWDQRDSVYTYSGSNEADFYDNCAAGEGGGGEYCYNPSDNTYSFDRSARVNNHRRIYVDTDNPDNRIAQGFGVARHEQKDLRALADPLGRGVRVDAYDETLATFNYGVFLQDKWAILSNLYVSGGVRWEIQDMRDIFGQTKILIWDNVAPRLGVVYDWTDEGKSRLYASYGWFYQPLPLQLNSRVFGGLVQVNRSYQQSDCYGQTTTTASGDAKPRIDANGQPTEYCVDSNSSTTGLTEGAIVPRLRGQYNQQFQLGYEHEVVEDLLLGVRWLHTDLGRAVEDVSTNGGQNFIIANPGLAVREQDIAAQQAECAELQRQFDSFGPDNDEKNVVARELNRCNFLVDAYTQVGRQYVKPTRNYDAWTIQVQKRFAKNWLLMASYTYSRLVGNYDGFVDPVNGSINIGASTQYDTPELVRNSYGPLSGNVPHRLKLDGFYSFDLGPAGRLTLGTSLRMSSGAPVNVRSDTPNFNYIGNYLIYLLPRGAGGQLRPNYQWNLSAGYAYPLPHDLELEFNVRVFNVTNAKAVLRVDNVYTFQAARPIAGGDLSDLKHAKVWAQGGGANNFFNREVVQPQGNFGVETSFQQPLSAQFELKLRF